MGVVRPPRIWHMVDRRLFHLAGSRLVRIDFLRGEKAIDSRCIGVLPGPRRLETPEDEID